MNANNRLVYTGVQILSIAAFILIWNYLVVFGVLPRAFVSAPLETFNAIPGIIYSANLYPELAHTMSLAFVAFALSVVVGIAVGLPIGTVKTLRDGLSIYVVLLFSIPRVILVPAFYLIFGLGIYYEVSFAFFSALLPIMLNTMFAVQNVGRNEVRAALSMGYRYFGIYRKVVLPTIVPSIMSGARISFNLALGGILIAEETVGNSIGKTGIGSQLVLYANTFKPVPLFATVAIMAIIAMAINMILLGVERWFTRWNAENR